MLEKLEKEQSVMLKMRCTAIWETIFYFCFHSAVHLYSNAQKMDSIDSRLLLSNFLSLYMYIYILKKEIFGDVFSFDENGGRTYSIFC